MKTGLEIAQRANLLDEASFILYQWVNQEEVEKSRARYADHYLTDTDNYNRKLDLICEMYHYVIDNIKAEKERVEYYFKERTPGYATFASLALLSDMCNTTGEIPSFRERMEAIGSERRVREYALNISGEEAANIPEEELRTLADLISFVETSSYDPSSKWEAIKIFNHQEAHYNEISKILSEVIELLNNKYSGQIAGLSQEFHEYWSEYQKNNDIIDTIHDTLKVSWRLSRQGTILMPVIFVPFSISISVDDIENKSKDIIRFGILQDNRMELTSSRIKKEDIIEIGKLLNDKSKVDILEFVSKKPCYGKEIANELNLSTATISYHVNALLKIGFLQAEVISNKVYYSIDRERISRNLEDVKGFFMKL
jgi:DNA-binding transcriptional ArsR family regulator